MAGKGGMRAFFYAALNMGDSAAAHTFSVRYMSVL